MNESSFESAAAGVLGPETVDTYRDALELAVDALAAGYFESATPYSGRSPEAIRAAIADEQLLPADGRPLDSVLQEVGSTICADSVGVYHPGAMAHLHCPPTIPALAASVIVAAMNQSMDSWDQSPSATALETAFVEQLAAHCGLADSADGVFTSGSTEANVTGLLLARNWAIADRFDQDAQQEGLPAEAQSMRILCSADAHFTARQAAAQLGLGDSAVVSVPTDTDHRLSIDELESTIERLSERSLEPMAVVGTAGTTDFGSIDPLDELASVASEHDLWFHVDAAYGGPLVFSERHRDRLAGIEQADSIAMDFHKLCQQPLSCGVFLVADGAQYASIDRSTAYLNPDGEQVAAEHHLVSKSLQTSRRFDALKPYVTFQTLGRRAIGAGIDSLIELASDTAAIVRGIDELSLVAEPQLSTVVFAFHSAECDPPALDTVNDRIRDRLCENGTAMIARTAVDGRTRLKFTFVNPTTSIDDVTDVLETIVATGNRLVDRSVAPPQSQ